MRKRTIIAFSEQMIPSFSLPSTPGGKPLGPVNFSQRNNLVMLFMDAWDCDHCRRLVASLREYAGEYRMLDAVVLVVVPETTLPQLAEWAAELKLGSDVILLADEDRSVTKAYSRDEQARPPFLIIADRYGAFYGMLEIEDGEDIDHREIESILRFIENQCPECGVPSGEVAM